MPFIYAKKKRPLTMQEFYAAASYSFTKQESTTLYVSREVLQPGERLLFTDDFFAAGSTCKAIEQIIEQAGATLVGRAVIINKSNRRDIEAILTMDDLATQITNCSISKAKTQSYKTVKISAGNHLRLQSKAFLVSCVLVAEQIFVL